VEGSAYEIMHETIPGTNQYRAIKVEIHYEGSILNLDRVWTHTWRSLNPQTTSRTLN